MDWVDGLGWIGWLSWVLAGRCSAGCYRVGGCWGWMNPGMGNALEARDPIGTTTGPESQCLESQRRESNPQPPHYECGALPIEATLASRNQVIYLWTTTAGNPFFKTACCRLPKGQGEILRSTRPNPGGIPSPGPLAAPIGRSPRRFTRPSHGASGHPCYDGLTR